MGSIYHSCLIPPEYASLLFTNGDIVIYVFVSAGASSTITGYPTDVIVLQHGSFRLSCSSNDANPAKNVKWWYASNSGATRVLVYSNGGLISPFDSIFTVISSSIGQVDLIASCAQLSDHGIYTCTDSEALQNGATVTVVGKLKKDR